MYGDSDPVADSSVADDEEEPAPAGKLTGGMIDGVRAVLIGRSSPLLNAAMVAIIRGELEVEDVENPTILPRVPVGIKKNACFVVNLRELKVPDDVFKDDYGVWKAKRGVQKVRSIVHSLIYHSFFFYLFIYCTDTVMTVLPN